MNSIKNTFSIVLLSILFIAWLPCIAEAAGVRLGTCDAGGSCCSGAPEDACDGKSSGGGAFVCVIEDPQVTLAQSRVLESTVGEWCNRSSMDRPVQWTDSGAWVGQDLVLADTVGRTLRRYSVHGRFKPEIIGTFSKNWSELYPVKLDGLTGKRVVVEIEGNRLLIFDSQYRFQHAVDLSSKINADGSMLDKLYDWILVGSDIVAFADVKTPRLHQGPPEDWSSGIVRFSLDKSQGFLQPQKLPLGDISRVFYRMGHSYLAAIGDTAYIMLMSNGFRLLKLGKDGLYKGELKSFNSLFPSSQPLPILPKYKKSGDYAPLMRVVEDLSLPVGLYAWEEKLYILWRRPDGLGTHWFLSQIDPYEDRIVATLKIPSYANHLFVTPGPHHWAFVEKGPVLALRDQEVRGLLTIPSEKIATAFRLSAQRVGGGWMSVCH